jgi:hypothetical protein
MVSLTGNAAGQSEATRCDSTTPDWPNKFEVRASASLSDASGTLASTSARGYPASSKPPCLTWIEDCNLVMGQGAQIQHRVRDNEDTWQEDDPPNEVAKTISEIRSERVVHQELPTCWAQIGQHGVNCLIDTGAQMNLLRFSASQALGLVYEEMNHPAGQERGVVTANGSMDSFVGTAWGVPVKVGEVTILTHFRIVRNLTRSVILGTPWCASARLAIQYNVFGRATCRIMSDDGRRNATFIASDPVPHHSSLVEPASGKVYGAV